MAARHHAVEAILRHLTTWPARSEREWEIGQAINDATTDVLAALPEDSPEVSAGLRKLLEARDCFLRAAEEARDGA